MNSSTAARNGDEGDDAFSFKNTTNCLTDACSSGVSELMRSARLSTAMVAFHSQYTLGGRGLPRSNLITREQQITTESTAEQWLPGMDSNHILTGF